MRVKNQIYQAVFNLEWVKKQLAALRPYSQAIDAWSESGEQDESRLLRGQALLDAQTWSQGKRLGDLDNQFLAASQELDRREVQLRLEADRTKEGNYGYHPSTQFSPDSRQLAIVSGSALFLEPFDFEQVSAIACEWLRDYLTHNPNITQSDTLRDSCVTPSVVEAGARSKVDN